MDTGSYILAGLSLACAILAVLGAFSWCRYRTLKTERAASEARFNDFASTAYDRFWEMDHNLRLTFISHSAANKGTIDVSELIGKTRQDAAVEDTSTERWQLHQRMLEEHLPFQNFEYESITTDGRRKITSTSGKPLFDSAGTFIGYRGVSSDVTHIVEAKEEETRRAKRLRAMLEACPFSAIVSNYVTREVIFTNDAAHRLFRSERSDMVGKRGLHLWASEEDRADVITEFQRTRRVAPRQVRLRRLDGSEFWGLVAWERLDPFGPDAIIAWHYDMDDEKTATDALREAKELAESASNAKSEFLSSMSHELRTPLNAILGFAQILESDLSDETPARQQRSVRQILDSAQHLMQLVNQLLELNRIESADLPVVQEEFALSDVVEECLLITGNEARRKSVSVFDSTDPTLIIRSDRTRVLQSLLNLLTNAIKYNEENGHVVIKHTISNGRMRISVNDTGMGIPIESQDKVFLPFERLGREHGTVEGTGIGLAISRRLIESVDGEIGFKSAPGEGSTFWIELPHEDIDDRERISDRRTVAR